VVSLGLAGTRTRAQALIRAGRVLVDDVPIDKPGSRVAAGAAVRVRGETRRYVSRGGDKLAGALADLRIDPTGLRALDLGASTGGFTDCLLQHGAVHVTAVDVGYGQLALELRRDPRVAVAERTNARHLTADRVPGVVDLVVVDVSFISATWVVAPLSAICPQAELLVLVKPQFEAGREHVGKGGVVRDDAARLEAVERVAGFACERGWREVGRAESRLAGPKGNREVFLHLRPAAAGSAAPEPGPQPLA